MRCIKCGAETGFGRICWTCMKSWKDRRAAAYEQAERELGSLCAENHQAIVKRIKQLEREAKKAAQS